MLLWDVLARSSAVLLMTAAASAALRGHSAALRHAVWACGLAGALAVAPLSWILPTWHVPLLTVEAEPLGAAAAPAPATLAAVTAAPPLAAVDAAPMRVAHRSGDAPTEAPPAIAAVVGASAAPVPAPDVREPRVAAGPAASPAWLPAIDVRVAFASVWAAGTLLLLLRLLVANVRTARVLRGAPAAAASAPWLPTARRLAFRTGVPYTRFVRAETITMPMAAGYVRPTVALPAEADAWPDERLTSVLLHELAHVRRRDCLTQLAASATCALYWMNPLAWYAARALRRERERACDDAVLAAGTAGPTYAEHLLDVARAARHVAAPTLSGGVAMAHRSELEGRLMAILDDARNRQSVSYGAAGLAAVLCLALVTPLAAIDPWALASASAQTAATAEPPSPVDTKVPRPSRPAPAAVSVNDAAPAVAPDPAAPALAPQAYAAPVPPAPPVPPAVTLVEPAPVMAPVDRPISVRVAVAPVVAPAMRHEFAFAFDDDVHVALEGVQSLPTPQPTPTPTPTPQPTPATAPGAARADRAARRERVATPADPRVIAALGAALKDSDVEVRQQAAHSLGQMRDAAAVDVLIPALQDADVEVRQNVVFALGQLRDVRAIPGLTVALKDANEEVRERAAFALSQLRDPRAIDPLLIAVRDANSDVRKQALFAIGQIDAARGKDAAIEALKDKDAEVRRMAAHLLGRLAHER